MNKSFFFLKTALIGVVFCALLPLTVSAEKRAEAYLTDSLPAAWSADSLLLPTLPTEDRWWIELGDTCLTSLIEEAVENNHNLLSAAERIKVARAMYNSQLAAYSPQIGLNGSWVNKQTSGSLIERLEDPSLYRYLDANLSVSWQIDLFGTIYFKSKSLKEQYNATRAEYNGAMVTLCEQVATHYIQLRTYQAQMRVAKRHILSQQAILRMTEVRFETGLESALDVAQAKTVYYSTRATIPQLEAAIEQQINAIAVMLGVYPKALHERLMREAAPVDYMRMVAVGIPYDLLRRRPDIQQAEYIIKSRAASLGAAITDYLPKITLNGSIGFASHDTSHFFDKNSLAFNITPTVTWTLFTGTERIQAHKLAKAQMQEAIEMYNNSVLVAVQEVENAISSYHNSIEQIVFLRELVNQGQLTLDLSLDLYKGGLIDFQSVLDAQRQLLSYQNSLEETYGKSAIALVNIYGALGGGWEMNAK